MNRIHGYVDDFCRDMQAEYLAVAIDESMCLLLLSSLLFLLLWVFWKDLFCVGALSLCTLIVIFCLYSLSSVFLLLASISRSSCAVYFPSLLPWVFLSSKKLLFPWHYPHFYLHASWVESLSTSISDLFTTMFRLSLFIHLMEFGVVSLMSTHTRP